MRCSKCGEECKDNQAFCLKCGNPIQVVPDFNLIEAELANNIGELLDEDKDEDRDNTDIEEKDMSDVSDMRTKKIDTDLGMELQMVNISRKKKEDTVEEFDVNSIDFDELDSELSDEDKDEGEDELELIDDTDEDNKVITEDDIEEEEPDFFESMDAAKKRKMIILSSIVGASVVVIIIVTVILINVLSKKSEYNKATYSSSYEKAEEYYSKADYSNAVEQIKIAIDKASSGDEKIKARLYLDTIYSMMTDVNGDRAANLLALTKLAPSNAEYAKKLAQLYTDMKDYSTLSGYLNSIENEEVLKQLSDFTIDAPKADFTTGSYNKFMTVKLTSEEGCKIYYTIHHLSSLDEKLDTAAPTTSSSLYSNGLSLSEEKVYVIQAIAVSDNGISSKMVEYRYAISLSTPMAPTVTPTTGKYTNYETLITITVPEGATAYYVYSNDENAEVSKESTVYTEPIPMKIGANFFKAIYVDANGSVSKVADKAYRLDPTRAFTVDSGEKKIIEYLMAENEVINMLGETKDKGKVNVKWVTSLTTELRIYDVFRVDFVDSKDVKIKTSYYGFDYCSGKNTVELKVTSGASTDIDSDNAYEPIIKEPETGETNENGEPITTAAP